MRRIRENSTVEKEINIDEKESIVMDELRKILSEDEKPQFTIEEFCVQAPVVAANNFQIKVSTIRMIQNSCQF